MNIERFTEKIKVDYPELCELYMRGYRNRNIDALIYGHSLFVLIAEDIPRTEYFRAIGIPDDFVSDVLESVELDFLLTYIEENIDIIHFKLL